MMMVVEKEVCIVQHTHSTRNTQILPQHTTIKVINYYEKEEA